MGVKRILQPRTAIAAPGRRGALLLPTASAPLVTFTELWGVDHVPVAVGERRSGRHPRGRSSGVGEWPRRDRRGVQPEALCRDNMAQPLQQLIVRGHARSKVGDALCNGGRQAAGAAGQRGRDLRPCVAAATRAGHTGGDKGLWPCIAEGLVLTVRRHGDKNSDGLPST
jgi:hypothetical protein